MAVNNTKLHILTHTARMLMMAQQKPGHNGTRHHQKQIILHNAQWDAIPPEERDEIVEAAEDIPDMTPEIIAAARAALEE